MELEDKPRANGLAAEIERRIGALECSHMKPLVDYVRGLRLRYPNAEFPDFDPLGGGCKASVLFLLEKPGPKTSREGGGSGFISACNDDPTANAMWHFMREAGIPISQSIHWNIIPGWDGTRRYFTKDIAEGLPHLTELLGLLPHLKAVILAGIAAGKAAPAIRGFGLPVVLSDHPGPMVRARYKERWSEIPRVWREGLNALS